jgi:isoaspartyl peptidase/L-asparaginase-like protein (Ntn-hydrolase superfamily)
LDDVRADREDIRADRNHWRQIAERGLLTDQRPPSERTPDANPEMTSSVEPTLLALPSTGGFWSRLFGRQGDSPSEQ